MRNLSKDERRTDEACFALLGGKPSQWVLPTCHCGGTCAPKPKAGNILSLKWKFEKSKRSFVSLLIIRQYELTFKTFKILEKYKNKTKTRTNVNIWKRSSWRRKWQPTPVLLPRKSHGRRSLVQATAHGVAKSQTRLSNFTLYIFINMDFMTQTVKNLPAMQETWVPSLGQEDPLEEKMAIHSSTLAWKIPWTEEPGGLPSMGWQRVGHNWATNT